MKNIKSPSKKEIGREILKRLIQGQGLRIVAGEVYRYNHVVVMYDTSMSITDDRWEIDDEWTNLWQAFSR